MRDADDLLTTAQAATVLGLDPSTVRHFVRDGRLPSVKPGRDLFIRRGDVEAFKALDRRPGYSLARPRTQSGASVPTDNGAGTTAFVSPAEAARLLGLSRQRISHLMAGGRFTVHREEGRPRIPRHEVDTFERKRGGRARRARPAPDRPRVRASHACRIVVTQQRRSDRGDRMAWRARIWVGRALWSAVGCPARVDLLRRGDDLIVRPGHHYRLAHSAGGRSSPRIAIGTRALAALGLPAGRYPGRIEGATMVFTVPPEPAGDLPWWETLDEPERRPAIRAAATGSATH